MSWVLTFVGFAALILLHELGHFAAAKAVGMRVERFSLFFPPHAWKRRRGETEYALGLLPLGGYVKITGMNPREEISPEVAHRAYYRQPVWKRIVVIAAGPAVNIVLAFLILWLLFWAHGLPMAGPSSARIAESQLRPPAAGVLRPGDRIVSVDGRGGGPEVVREQIARHRCPGAQTDGCQAATPARVVVQRGQERLTFHLRPVYREKEDRPLLGFAFQPPPVRFVPTGPASAATFSLDRMWDITTISVSAMARIFEAERRKEISGIVGTSTALSERFKLDLVEAMFLLGVISLSLAIINLFPFLPLDGGHIFWALAEKVRRRPIPFEVMERSMAVGFVLVITLFVIGLSNDIGRLRGEGFGPPR